MDFIDIIDDRSDEELKAFQRLLDVSRGEEGNWRELRQDYSTWYWKPKLRIVEEEKFPYHAYAVNSQGVAEKEGEYRDERNAKDAASDLAAMLNNYR